MITQYHDRRLLGVAAHNAGLKSKLYDPDRREFLHMSGAGRTKKEVWAWLGTAHQAETLRRKAIELGEEWPWKIVRR